MNKPCIHVLIWQIEYGIIVPEEDASRAFSITGQTAVLKKVMPGGKGQNFPESCFHPTFRIRTETVVTSFMKR
jgi:hypothetical protein